MPPPWSAAVELCSMRGGATVARAATALCRAWAAADASVARVTMLLHMPQPQDSELMLMLASTLTAYRAETP